MRVLSVRSKKLFFIVCITVHCLKIIGLAPFSVPIGKPAQINPCNSCVQAFFISKFGRAYNVLLSISVIVVPVLLSQSSFSVSASITHGDSVIHIQYVIWIAKRILIILTTSVIMISWAFRQKNAACIMNKLLEVDLRLSGLKKRPFNKRALIFLCVHVILNACLWITYSVFMVNYLIYDNPVAEFFMRASECIIYWFIIEYFTIVGLVSRDLQTVNKYLLDLEEEFGNNQSRPPVRNANVLPVVISVQSTQSRSQLIASLKLLRGIRTTMFELCEDIAGFFSLPILFCIACCFIPIFIFLYYIIQIGNYSLPAGYNACLIVIIVLQYLYPIVSLTLNVTQTTKEAELTAQIVHKLLAVARTEEIKAELELFSLQLLHEKINFTAYGLFTLDSTLLQSSLLRDIKNEVSFIMKIPKLQMLGGVASYAIILTQFRSSVCDGNDNGNGKNASAVE